MKNIMEATKSQQKKSEKTDVVSKTSEKKRKLGVFVNCMKDIKKSESKEKKINCCGDFIRIYTNEQRTVKTLAGGSFCNDRLCPICSWRFAKKMAFEILELLEYARVIENKEFIFLTLTAPNVSADGLKAEIDDFNKAFKRLSEIEAFKKINKGYIRKLEITYNAERADFHPHFHVLVAVNRSYFKKKDYISRAKFLEMWKNAKRDASITQVDVRKVEMNSIAEVLEIATYATKHKDLYSSVEVFKVFYESLKRRQIVTFNGLFKELRKLQEDKELNLSELSRLEAIKEYANLEIFYKWQGERYEEYQERMLTAEEIKKIYNIEIDFDE